TNAHASTTLYTLSLHDALPISIAVAISLPSSSGAAEPKRPNIVFIFSDDHAYQAISAYGDARKLIETPNIDRISREGMRFNRCLDRKSTRLNSSHQIISYAVFC